MALEPFARVYRVRGDSLTEIPSQLDDVDQDGWADELFFLIDLNANETARYVIRPDSMPPGYSSRIDSTSLLDHRFPEAGGLTPDRAALWTQEGFASISNLDSARISLIADGPLRVLVRTHGELEIDGARFVVSETVERHAGSRWIEHRMAASRNPDRRPFVAGLPRYPGADRLHSGSIHGQFYLYTLGRQSSDGSLLGFALLVPERLRPRLLPINPTDHRIQIASEDGASAYRYMAARAENAAGDAAVSDSLTHEMLLEMISRAADRWTNPVQATVTYDRPGK